MFVLKLSTKQFSLILTVLDQKKKKKEYNTYKYNRILVGTSYIILLHFGKMITFYGAIDDLLYIYPKVLSICKYDHKLQVDLQSKYGSNHHDLVSLLYPVNMVHRQVFHFHINA